MSFQLKEGKRNKVDVTYYVLDAEQSICGSINVKVEEEQSFLKHWTGGGRASSSPQPRGQQQSPIGVMAAAFLKHARPQSQQSILRGC